MNKDQKLLEEAYQKVLKEETNLEKALKEIEVSSKEAETKKEEKLKDLSQIVSGQLGTDEKGNFIYKPSGYEHGKFYKSRFADLFDEDLKEVPRGTPVKEGMFWTEQGINTKEVYRAKNVHGRLMIEKVPPQEVKEKGLSYLMSERELQAEATNKGFGGNVDEALGWRLAHVLPIKFGVKFYEPERVFRVLEERRQAIRGSSQSRKAFEDVIEKYKKAFKEKELNSNLSKDFDIRALEDF